MDEVNHTLENTVRFWNTVEFIPIGPFTKISTAPSAAVRASYRYDRDMAVSLSLVLLATSVRNSYRDPSVILEMERSLGAFDLLLGFSYFFPLARRLEAQLFVDAGALIARADAVTFNSRVEKVGSETETRVYYDTVAEYRKAKVIAAAGAAVTWSGPAPFFVRADLTYRFANVGEMEGTVRRIEESFEGLSQTAFDFSSFSLTVGVGYHLE